MAQPSTQLLLDSGHAFYGYFWYANGTGLWDARNGAMATKTGSGAVTATGEAGANVADSDGTTSYTPATSLSYGGGTTATLSFKVKETTAGDNGMSWGDMASRYFWLRASEIRYTGLTIGNSSPTSWATYTIVWLANGTTRYYKNGAFVSAGTYAGAATITRIMAGYSSGLALNGAMEFFHFIPGLVADDTQVASLYADPYQALITASPDGTGTGSPAAITIVAPTATASGTGGADGTGTGAPASVSLTAPTATAAGTTAGSGTITTPALKNNTGTVLASISGWSVNVYNVTTGAFIVQKTGLTTSAGGVLTITDASIVSGTTYAYEPFHATYGRRLPTSAAV